MNYQIGMNEIKILKLNIVINDTEITTRVLSNLPEAYENVAKNLDD